MNNNPNLIFFFMSRDIQERERQHKKIYKKVGNPIN